MWGCLCLWNKYKFHHIRNHVYFKICVPACLSTLVLQQWSPLSFHSAARSCSNILVWLPFFLSSSFPSHSFSFPNPSSSFPNPSSSFLAQHSCWDAAQNRERACESMWAGICREPFYVCFSSFALMTKSHFLLICILSRHSTMPDPQYVKLLNY